MMMMKILKANGNFKNNKLFLIGILIIVYILFIRLLFKRLPKDLNIELPF